MGLSDACLEFLEKIREASDELAVEVEHYAEPPFDYGEEIEGLRAACKTIKDNEFHQEKTLVQLVQLSYRVAAYHFTPPFTAESEQRKERMEALITLFRENLSPEDAREAEQAVAEVTKNDNSVEKPARILNLMVKKLGKSAYDIAIRVISDVASETAKKFLDLK